MKQITISSFPSRKDSRFGGLALTLILLIWFGLTPSAAQLQNQRRVTSVRAADAPEGSKVTVVSDSALNDYEAYRRGDRFYVKVPQAGLAESQPQLRGNGFDDVEVQKAGDGIVFSFRLKPGTGARVSQRMNRLDVIFSTPAGSQNAGAATTRLPNVGGGQTRAPGVAGPVVPGTTRNTRDPRNASEVREGTSAAQTRAADPNSRNAETPTEQSGAAGSETGSSSSGEASTGSGNSELPSEAQTPVASPVSSTTPSTTTPSQTATNPSTLFEEWSTFTWLLLLVGLLFLVGLAVLFAKRKSSESRVDEKRWQTRVTPKPRVATGRTPGEPVFANTVSRAVGKPAGKAAESTRPPIVPSVPVVAEVKSTDEDSAISTSPDDFQEFETNQMIAAVPLSNAQHSEPQPGPATPSSEPSLETNPSPADDTLMEVAVDPADETLIEVVMDPAPPLPSVPPAATPASVPENQGNYPSGIQGFELQAFEEFMESRVSEQAPAIEVAERTPPTPPTPQTPQTSPTLQAPPAAPSTSVDDELAAEETRLLLQEQALLRAAEALDERRLVAEDAKRTAEAEAQLQADLEGQADADAEKARIRAATEASQHAELETFQRFEQDARRRSDEEEVRRTLEAELLINADAEAVRCEEEENRFRLEAETLRRAAEDLARKRMAAEAARKAAEDEARVRLETEARRQAAEMARLRVEEEAQRELKEAARRLLEEEMRLRAEEEASRLAAAEAGRRAEAQRQQREAAAAARYVEEEKLRLEHEALLQAVAELTRRRAEVEQARIRAAEEKRLLLDLSEQIRVEDEQQGLALERKRFEAEAARRSAQESARIAEAHRRAVAEQKRVEELARLSAEEGERRLSELENVRRQAEERTRHLAEQEENLRAEIELLLQAEEDQRQRVEAETQRRSEAETRLREEETRRRAEVAQLHADQARLQAGDDARAQMEAEARRLAEEALVRAETEARLRAEREAHALVEKGTELGSWAEGGVLDAPVISVETTTPGVVVEDRNETTATAVSPSWHPTEPANGFEIPPADKSVAQLSEGSSIPSDILRKFNSAEPSERSWALAELAQIGGDDAFHFINRAFDDPIPDVRSAAARALYDAQSERAASFTRALRGSSPERQRAIGEALATSGLANDAIGNLTGESREKTYDAFSLLFLMAKAGAVQPLLNAIEEHESIEVRLAVVKLIVLSGQTEVVPAFRRLAVHGSLPLEVRSVVLDAIYQISSQSREGVPVA